VARAASRGAPMTRVPEHPREFPVRRHIMSACSSLHGPPLAAPRHPTYHIRERVYALPRAGVHIERDRAPALRAPMSYRASHMQPRSTGALVGSSSGPLAISSYPRYQGAD